MSSQRKDNKFIEEVMSNGIQYRVEYSRGNFGVSPKAYVFRQIKNGWLQCCLGEAGKILKLCKVYGNYSEYKEQEFAQKYEESKNNPVPSIEAPKEISKKEAPVLPITPPKDSNWDFWGDESKDVQKEVFSSLKETGTVSIAMLSYNLCQKYNKPVLKVRSWLMEMIELNVFVVLKNKPGWIRLV